MKWKKKQIYIEDLHKITEQLQQLVKEGAEIIEDLRCVYIQEDTNMTFMLMPYDFLDLNPRPAISKFFLYQAFKT